MNGIANNYKHLKPIDIAIQGFDRPDEVYVMVVDNRIVYFGYQAQCDAQMHQYPVGFMFLYRLRDKVNRVNNTNF